MIIVDVEQGSPEWHQARLGIPTASDFKRLVTPTGKPSTQINGYVNELVAESLMGKKLSGVETFDMQRGTQLEPQARAWYEFHTDQIVNEVGFVLRDDRQVGCSPDGLTEFSGLEIKCPKADKQIGHLLLGGLPPEYMPQIQGCLWICERDKWDFVSYHEELPGVLHTVGRDEKLIKTLENQVRTLIELKMAALESLLETAA